ncbi:hypothetical protein AGMMS50233_10490 [Endomicrobiia bacterium]|nr:hypothetical protein AGMMS50233_10490 [Endomicrobiia bacterium]
MQEELREAQEELRRAQETQEERWVRIEQEARDESSSFSSLFPGTQRVRVRWVEINGQISGRLERLERRVYNTQRLQEALGRTREALRRVTGTQETLRIAQRAQLELQIELWHQYNMTPALNRIIEQRLNGVVADAEREIARRVLRRDVQTQELVGKTQEALEVLGAPKCEESWWLCC